MHIVYTEEILDKMRDYLSGLPERSRRQYAALEAIKLGHGGISYMSNQLGIDRKTIQRGKKELSGQIDLVPAGRQRRIGGGRKKNDGRK